MVFMPDGSCPAESATQYKDAIKFIEIIPLGKVEEWKMKVCKK